MVFVMRGHPVYYRMCLSIPDSPHQMLVALPFPSCDSIVWCPQRDKIDPSWELLFSPYFPIHSSLLRNLHHNGLSLVPGIQPAPSCLQGLTKCHSLCQKCFFLHSFLSCLLLIFETPASRPPPYRGSLNTLPKKAAPLPFFILIIAVGNYENDDYFIKLIFMAFLYQDNESIIRAWTSSTLASVWPLRPSTVPS